MKQNSKYGYHLLLLMFVFLSQCLAQAERKITILMLDSQSGQPILDSELQVWSGISMSSAKTAGISPRYVKPGSDGRAEMSLPADGNVFTVHAQYGKASWGYVNCDRTKDHGTFHEHWYSTDDVISSGIVAPNFCSKLTIPAKPGQFIFFVRPMSFFEKFHR